MRSGSGVGASVGMAGTARLLGGCYREVRLDGGHVWMFGRWPDLVTVLAEAPGAIPPHG